MTSDFARRTTWRIAWLGAALGAISLGSLVHVMTDAPLQQSLLAIVLHAVAAIGFLTLSARCAARALDASSDARTQILHAHRWQALEPLVADRPTSRAA